MRAPSKPRRAPRHRARCAPLLAAALALGGCGGGDEAEEPLRKPTLIELDLRSPIDEGPRTLFDRDEPRLFEAIEEVRELADEELAAGLFLRLGPMAGHLADASDWAETIAALRAAHKPVHCHFDELDNAGYALAAQCDHLTMSPPGTLDLVGLALQSVHLAELLRSIGIEAQLMQVGKYKGAAEPLTRDEMSEPLRENRSALLDELDESFRDSIVQGRHVTREALSAIIDSGPYTSRTARAAGLVDHVAYDDEARQRAKEVAKAVERRVLFAPRKHELSIGDLLKALSGSEETPAKGKRRLALVTLTGEILSAKRNRPNISASEPFIAHMRKLADTEEVRAVVLRIDSPGGSAVASDRMWHAVRRVAGRKPVIVTLGNVAASGGYYIASAGTHILATPSSLVGSIGVVGGKIVVAELARKAGVHVQTLARGRHAAWLNPLEPFSESAHARFSEMLEDTYRLFVERVALGRKLSLEEVEKAAEGRVMGGRAALSLKLIDEIGGLHRAFELARERGGLARDAPLEVWPDNADPFAGLGALLGGARLFALGLPESLGRVEPQRSVETAPGGASLYLRDGATQALLLHAQSWVAALANGQPATLADRYLRVR